MAQRDSIAASIAKGDRAGLEALRLRLAREIDATVSPRIFTSLSRAFVLVIEALADLKAPTTSKIDEIAKRRARRRAAARVEPEPL